MPRRPAATPARNRGGRRRGAAEAPAAAPVVEDTTLYPKDTVLKNLVRAKASAKSRTGEINGETGGLIADAVENKHLDRKAFTMVCQLNAMADEKLAVTLPHLLRYVNVLGLVQRANAQPVMLPTTAEGVVTDGNGEAPAPAGGGDNVIPVGTAARRVAERAGQPIN